MGGSALIGGRAWRAALFGGLLVIATLAFAPRADAFIYFTNEFGTAIGRANIDGTGVQSDFIPANGGCSVAVDGGHVYWSHTGGGTTIGRANLDGTGVDQNFITGASDPCGVTIRGSQLYWANPGNDTIGRADLNGDGPATNVMQSFVPVAEDVCAVAVDDTSIYWNDGGVSIGRAKLDGTGANPNFIPTLNGGLCSSLTINSAHIYFADSTDASPNSSNTIGRANLDGSGLNEEFIDTDPDTCGVAVDDQHVYWGNFVQAGVGRSNLNGSGADADFIPTATAACGLTTDTLKRSTSMNVNCSPNAVAGSQPTTCTAAVVDIHNGPPTPPDGTVSFTSSASGSSFGSGSSCTLSQIDVDVARCSVKLATPHTANVLAVFGGSASHDSDSGLGSVTVSNFSLGGVVRDTRRGTATLTVFLPGPGSVALEGEDIAGATKQAQSDGDVTLPVKATGHAKRRLKRKRKAAVTAEVTFTPAGGGVTGTGEIEIKLRKLKRR